jgi:hypothetical protein
MCLFWFFCAIGLTFSLDPMWVYGEPVELPNRQILTYTLCDKRIYGGISRLKYHLAKITGFDVDIFLNSSLEIMCIANKSLIDMDNKRDVVEACKKELELANRNTGISAYEGDQYHNPTPQPQGPQLLQFAHQPHLSLSRGQHLGGNLLFGH